MLRNASTIASTVWSTTYRRCSTGGPGAPPPERTPASPPGFRAREGGGERGGGAGQNRGQGDATGRPVSPFHPRAPLLSPPRRRVRQVVEDLEPMPLAVSREVAAGVAV